MAVSTRLNRYLALSGLGTRRSVERLIRTGRIAIDGRPVMEPGTPVTVGAIVTIDDNPVAAVAECGVVIALSKGELPVIAHPAELHVAGRDDNVAVLLSDHTLAGKLVSVGFEARRVEHAGLAVGEFRPLSPAELSKLRVLPKLLKKRR